VTKKPRFSCSARLRWAGALASNKTVVLHIAGQRYAIRTDADERYLKDLARFVEERFSEIRQGSQSSPPYKVAMLTALNIADELYRMRRDGEKLKKEVRGKSQKLLTILEKALQEPTSGKETQ
jgi:cell division protein ZapA